MSPLIKGSNFSKIGSAFILALLGKG